VRRLLTWDWFFMALSQMPGLVTFQKATAGALREPADGIQ
jgi:hypothetical protein